MKKVFDNTTHLLLLFNTCISTFPEVVGLGSSLPTANIGAIDLIKLKCSFVAIVGNCKFKLFIKLITMSTKD